MCVRLRGRDCQTIAFRGRRGDATTREALLRDRLLDRRVFLARAKGYPVALISVQRYDEASLDGAALAADAAFAGAGAEERVGKSYAGLLHAMWCPCIDVAVRHERPPHPDVTAYNPLDIDDPNAAAADNRQVVARQGFIYSIVAYRTPKQLKDGLNERFRELHPWVHADLTLTMIRSLKAKALAIAVGADLEVGMVALAIAYFEKLTAKRFVIKGNRKLMMAVCLLLALKFIDPHTAMREVALTLFERVEAVLGVARAAVKAAEFDVFVLLGFGVHTAPADVLPHFERLIAVGGARWWRPGWGWGWGWGCGWGAHALVRRSPWA